MASDFQRRKVTGVFDAMDVDRDGFLAEPDFQALAARWTANRGLAPESAECARLTAIMLGWWAALRSVADADRDDKVTLDEVLLVVDQLGGMLDAVTGTAEAMFGAIDADGDGRISAQEYRELIETWNGCPTDTGATFSLLDLDGDGSLSCGEFVELWTQFWVGDDPSAAGTWVFGRLAPAGV